MAKNCNKLILINQDNKIKKAFKQKNYSDILLYIKPSFTFKDSTGSYLDYGKIVYNEE